MILTRRSGLSPCWQEYHNPYTGHHSSIDEARLHDWMSERMVLKPDSPNWTTDQVEQGSANLTGGWRE